jgi:hypothetical protein
MSRKDDIKKLILKHKRRLQKLKEKQTTFGLDTPPHISIEIEDIEVEIENLQTELEVLKNSSIAAEIQRALPELAEDTTYSTSSDVHGKSQSPSYLLKLDINENGESILSQAELMAVAGDTIFAVENGDIITHDINFSGLNSFLEVLNIPVGQLNAAQRAARPEFLRHVKFIKKQLGEFSQALEIILSTPVFTHVDQPDALMHVFNGLGKRLFGEKSWTLDDKHEVLDLYFNEDQKITTVIYFRPKESDDTNYWKFLGGGWDLYDMPRYVRLEYAIPAIVLECLYLKEKGEIDEIEDTLNLYKWKVGLR